MPEIAVPEGFTPTRWWRVVDSAGKLWCETSSSDEARDSMRPGDRLQHLFQRTEYHWADVETGDARLRDSERGELR